MSSVPQGDIKHKVGLLNLATELGNVSRACKVMGFSRDTFYRYQSAVEAGGVDALINANRKKPKLKNRVEEAAETAVVAFSLEQPAFGQVRASNEPRKRGIFISPSAVRLVWLRRDLESFKKRLKALEAHVAATGEVLTEAQVVALERKQDDDVAHGEIETAHPGYLHARAVRARECRLRHRLARHDAFLRQGQSGGRQIFAWQCTVSSPKVRTWYFGLGHLKFAGDSAVEVMVEQKDRTSSGPCNKKGDC
ncbi:Mobile element protein [Janthinobacterium sp. CG23_2]|nr:Mobile element protein [Janthinobacterium sp. CG23_2]CUU28411.1 Mobile element protein [Janthinobacterium sp. CG23_2]